MKGNFYRNELDRIRKEVIENINTELESSNAKEIRFNHDYIFTEYPEYNETVSGIAKGEYGLELSITDYWGDILDEVPINEFDTQLLISILECIEAKEFEIIEDLVTQ